MCISIHDMQLVISTHGVLQQANNAHRIMQEVESVHRKYAQCSTAGEECVRVWPHEQCTQWARLAVKMSSTRENRQQRERNLVLCFLCPQHLAVVLMLGLYSCCLQRCRGNLPAEHIDLLVGFFSLIFIRSWSTYVIVSLACVSVAVDGSQSHVGVVLWHRAVSV